MENEIGNQKNSMQLIELIFHLNCITDNFIWDSNISINNKVTDESIKYDHPDELHSAR